MGADFRLEGDVDLLIVEGAQAGDGYRSWLVGKSNAQVGSRWVVSPTETFQ